MYFEYRHGVMWKNNLIDPPAAHNMKILGNVTVYSAIAKAALTQKQKQNGESV